MLWQIVGLVVGLLAAASSGWSLVVAYRALAVVPAPPEELLRAFKRLESDFEELSDRVASQLGRISRLKRDTLQLGRQEGAAPPGAPPGSNGAGAVPPPTPLTRSRLLALSKKNQGGLTYAEEQNRSGIDVGWCTFRLVNVRDSRVGGRPRAARAIQSIAGDPGFFGFLKKAFKIARPFARFIPGIGGAFTFAEEAARHFGGAAEGIPEGGEAPALDRDAAEEVEGEEEGIEGPEGLEGDDDAEDDF